MRVVWGFNATSAHPVHARQGIFRVSMIVQADFSDLKQRVYVSSRVELRPKVNDTNPVSDPVDHPTTLDLDIMFSLIMLVMLQCMHKYIYRHALYTVRCVMPYLYSSTMH